MIHVLHSGAALCGLAGVPRDWPDGHRWVALRDSVKATCGVCRVVGIQRLTEPPERR